MSKSEPVLPIMYIILNEDLKLSQGASLAQVVHITQKLTEEVIRAGYEIYPPPDTYISYMKWKDQCTVIVKQAPTSVLHELSGHKEARSMWDQVKGARHQPEEARYLTSVGFFPSTEITNLVKDLKLFGKK
jgi:peptidyl-tRNA hydrolase